MSFVTLPTDQRANYIVLYVYYWKGESSHKKNSREVYVSAIQILTDIRKDKHFELLTRFAT